MFDANKRLLEYPHELIPRHIFLRLMDNNLEQKKNASLMLVRHVRNLVAGRNFDRVDIVVCLLLQHFVSSPKPNLKIGGLLGLAALAVALGPQNIHLYEEHLLGGALTGVFAQSMNIKLYSCESLYNIVKVSRGRILEYSPIIFEVLLRLCSDPFPQVATASRMLNSLISDIFLERYTADISSDFQNTSGCGNKQPNNIARMITDLVSQHITAATPGAQLFLMEWLRLLNSLPKFYILEFLPDFLKNLIEFLNDNNSEVSVTAYKLLDNFLDGLLDAMYNSYNSNIPITLYSHKLDVIPKRYNNDDTDGRLNTNFTPILRILIYSLRHYDGTPRAVCLKWIGGIILALNESMLACISVILEILLKNMSHESQDIRDAAFTAAGNLYTIVKDSPLSKQTLDNDTEQISYYNSENIKSISSCLNAQCCLGGDETKVEVMKWYIMLLEKFKTRKEEFEELIDSCLVSSLHCFSSRNNSVFDTALGLVCEILKMVQGERFDSVVRMITEKLCTRTDVLKERGYLIIIEICTSIEPQLFYKRIVHELLSYKVYKDKKYTKSLVFTLYNTLMTSPKLNNLRNLIVRFDKKESLELFLTLYDCWCDNFIPLISLCFLAAAYEHAFNIISLYSTENMDAQTLTEIEEFILLLESPAFTHMRFRLAQSDTNPYLLRSICGLLMLIPQANAYNLLCSRLIICVIQCQADKSITNPKTYIDDNTHDYRSDVRWDDLLSKYQKALHNSY